MDRTSYLGEFIDGYSVKNRRKGGGISMSQDIAGCKMISPLSDTKTDLAGEPSPLFPILEVVLVIL